MGDAPVPKVVVHDKTLRAILFDVGVLVTGLAGMYIGLKYIVNNMDPTKDRKKDRKVPVQVLKRLKQNGFNAEMGDYEATMLQHITFPGEIDVTMEDIGGCDAIKEAVEEIFILPMVQPEIFKDKKLLSPPKGMLFYGAPGTGKTMMAKAICKCTGSTFFNIRMSAIQSKWFGDSVRLIEGLFSLARKMAPSVIFIDEMDAFLHRRGMGRDQDGTLAMKSEFMSLWDGLIADTSAGVLVLGATNRLQDIDKAILRRLPRKFEFKLPDVKSRETILRKLLAGNRLDTQGEFGQPLTFPLLAKLTIGYSGSDLLELCRSCAMIPLKEYIRQSANNNGDLKVKVNKNTSINHKHIPRSLSTGDFMVSMQNVRPTGQAARLYAQRMAAQELAGR
ncbi:hypothetical protein AAMO2058_000000900 [Amorphochlora amoebiformis]